MKCTKVCHPTQADATLAMRRAIASRKPKASDDLVQVYKCEECSEPGAPAWHWGHRKLVRRGKP